MWDMAVLRRCRLVEAETGQGVRQVRHLWDVLGRHRSQTQDGTEVTNQPMSDAVVTYPPSPSPDAFSRPVSFRSSVGLGQLSAADAQSGSGGCERHTGTNY